MTTKEQRQRIEDAKNAIKRRIAQMVSSGEHDMPACIEALREIEKDMK